MSRSIVTPCDIFSGRPLASRSMEARARAGEGRARIRARPGKKEETSSPSLRRPLRSCGWKRKQPLMRSASLLCHRPNWRRRWRYFAMVREMKEAGQRRPQGASGKGKPPLLFADLSRRSGPLVTPRSGEKSCFANSLPFWRVAHPPASVAASRQRAAQREAWAPDLGGEKSSWPSRVLSLTIVWARSGFATASSCVA